MNYSTEGITQENISSAGSFVFLETFFWGITKEKI